MKTTIRDGRNQIKGYLEHSESDRLRAYDKHNVLAGYYSANMDRTYDAHGRIVGMGDQRMILLEDQD
jgi:hypothetical protein